MQQQLDFVEVAMKLQMKLHLKIMREAFDDPPFPREARSLLSRAGMLLLQAASQHKAHEVHARCRRALMLMQHAHKIMKLARSVRADADASSRQATPIQGRCDLGGRFRPVGRLAEAQGR